MIEFSNVKKWLIGGVEVKKVVRVLDSTVLWQAIQRVLKEWRGSSPLTCTPTIVNPFEEIRVYGDSKQNPIKSVNLVDKDNLINGFYSSSGVLSEKTTETYKTYDKFPVKPSTNYTFSSNATSSTGYNWRICYWDSSKGFIRRTAQTINEKSLTITTTADTYYLSISPERQGWNYDLQVEEGDTATPYVPYMIDTPTPQTPIEIESVGEKSKNLFSNTGQVTRTYSNGLSINLNKARLIMDCTANTGNYQTLREFQMDLKANIPYTFSWTGTFENATLLLVTTTYTAKSSISQSLRTHTFTLTEDTTLYLAIRCTTPNVPTLADINIQLEEGTQATPYEPYNTYKVPVEVRGKNLFDKDSVNIPKGWYDATTLQVGQPLPATPPSLSSNYRTSDIIKVAPNETYYMVGIGGGNPSVLFLDKDLNFLEGFRNSNETKRLITVPNNVNIRYMRVPFATATQDTAQLELGTRATSYQPYVEPVTTNIYLNEPLRKVGEYSDTMSVNGNEVTVVRNIYEIKGENLPITLRSDFETSGDMYVTFGYQQTFPRCIAGLTGTIRILCSNYKAIPTVFRGSALDKSVCLENGYKTFNIKDTSMIGKTVSEIQSEISDYVFTYVIDTPTTETYTIDTPINALDNTSVIIVDTTIPPSELYASQYVEE